MCGIAGLVSFNGNPIEPGILDAMTDALSHRGPDGRGTYIHQNVGLGHRRLSILDLSTSASQPMTTHDGRFTIVFNGEIYNFAALRTSLEASGHVFRSTGDTEVLLQLYASEGAACLEKLRGMFAFAIHDRERQTIFLARDRVGKKPIKYFHQNGIFAFASELKALRKVPGYPREIDWEAIHHFLGLTYLPAPRTGIKDILKLPAAHSLTLDLKTGETRIERYWALRYQPDRAASVEEWKERVMPVLEESVRLRMVADVPVGAFLSGGVDSATIVALMSKLHAKPVKTFSIGSDDPTSELGDAARIAALFGTDHHPISVQPDIVHLLPELVRTYEEPFGDPSVIPTYLISCETRNDATVALSGDGGDENFGGYLRYPILRFAERWSRMPGGIHTLAAASISLFRMLRNDTFSERVSIFQHAARLPWEQRMLHYMGAFEDQEKRSIERYPSRFPATDAWHADQYAETRSRADDLIHGAMLQDLETYLPEDLMPKVDLGAMAHGLEVRSPFLDHTLLELTATIPSELQVRGWETKWILKEMLKDLLPPETLQKKKQGFRLPLDRWFRGELQSFVREKLLTGNPLFWEMFDQKQVARYLDEYEVSRIDRSPQIWMLLWLVEWTEQNA